MNSLNKEDLKELLDTGLPEPWIQASGIKSISLNELISLGFYAKKPDSDEGILEPKYIESALYFPFYNSDGSMVFDEKTNAKIAVIKPRYTPYAKENFEKLPKYLCLPKNKQSRMRIHFPKSFDWKNFFEDTTTKILYITEGLKKAEAACCRGIPCIALWSVWCGTEGKLESSDLIKELKDVLIKTDKEICVVFDSDKSFKPNVLMAEKAFINKVFLETGKISYVKDLPQKFKNHTTKGLDDYLLYATKKNFYLLPERQEQTNFIKSFDHLNTTPKAPIDKLPDIFKRITNDLNQKLEGCIEMAPMALIASIAGVCKNVFKINGTTLNVYFIGLSPTTSGKTTIVSEVLKPLKQYNSELENKYQEDILNQQGQEKPHNIDDSFILPNFTREGFISYMSFSKRTHTGIMIESEEFEILLQQMKKDYNCGLASFIIKLYDSAEIRDDLTRKNFEKLTSKKKIDPVIQKLKNISFSMLGVSNAISYLENQPENYLETGFFARLNHFIGVSNKKIIPIPGKLHTAHYERLLEIYRIIGKTSIDLCKRKKEIDFHLDEEANELWERIYFQNQTKLNEDPNSPENPSIKRDLMTAHKLAAIFELVIRAENCLNSQLLNEEIYSSDRISLMSMDMALAWSQYFIETDKYIFRNHINKRKNSKNLTTDLIKFLRNYPSGISRTEAKKKIGLHRTHKQNELFDSLIQELREEFTIEIVKGKNSSQIIKIRDYLVNYGHTDAQLKDISGG
jgi:hypothetical protein